MRSTWIWAAAAAALCTAGAASAAPSVEIKHAAARVVVIPEARSDVKVEFITTNPALPMTISQEGERVVVHGGLQRRIRGCHGELGKTTVHVRGVGDVSWDKLPQIVARVPMNAEVGVSGAVFGSVARADALTLDNAGCGDWTVGNIKGPLNINVEGSGDTRAGTAGELRVRIEGSGDVSTQAVGGGADVSIAGSGDVKAASINGPLHARVMGSGDVVIAGGSASEMKVDIAGSGDVDFGGAAQTLSASVMGSGDVRAGSVAGQVHRSVMGSGSVYVAGQEIKPSKM